VTALQHIFGPIGALWLTATVSGQPPAANDTPPQAAAYERWVHPLHLAPSERRLFDAIQSWAGRAGLRVIIDPRLTHAARALLPYVPRQAGETIDLNRARALAQGWGCTDGQLAAIAIRIPQNQSAEQAVVAQLETQQPPLTINRFGLAESAAGGESTAIVLLSRRLLQLMPLSARVRANQEVVVAGRLATGVQSSATQVQVLVGLEQGRVQRLVPVVHNQQFEQRLRVPGTVGTIDVQLLVDSGRGPEVAALFPIGVGCNPRPAAASSEPSASPGAPLDAAQIEQALVSLILGARQAQDLPLPAESALLTETARAHALDMETHGFFAHVSPSSGDVTDRLRSRGVHYRKVLENLAVASTAEEIFQDWMASPAHRANLLDPQADFVGVGVALVPDRAVPSAYAVAVLARLDESIPTQGPAEP